MIENKVVVADPGDVPQRARTQADEARSPDHFFAAGIGINAIDDQRQPVACSRAAPEARQQFREIVLVEQAQGRIVHLARSEEHTSELQSLTNLVCRLLLEKK